MFEWNVCAEIWLTDLLQMSLSTLCLNKTKYDPSQHMQNLKFLFENEMNEIGVCENDENRDCNFERTFGFYHLISLFVSLLWFDSTDPNTWSLICLICDQFVDQMIIQSIKSYRLTIFSVLYFWVVNAVNKWFLLRKVHVELALVLC